MAKMRLTKSQMVAIEKARSEGKHRVMIELSDPQKEWLRKSQEDLTQRKTRYSKWDARQGVDLDLVKVQDPTLEKNCMP